MDVFRKYGQLMAPEGRKEIFLCGLATDQVPMFL